MTRWWPFVTSSLRPCALATSSHRVATARDEAGDGVADERVSDTSCFINGESEYVAVTGKGKVEIWDILSGSSLRVIGLGDEELTLASYSVNNVLAVGGSDKMTRLYDVRTWDMILSKAYDAFIISIHLTSDLKYLIVGGQGGCWVEKFY